MSECDNDSVGGSQARGHNSFQQAANSKIAEIHSGEARWHNFTIIIHLKWIFILQIVYKKIHALKRLEKSFLVLNFFEFKTDRFRNNHLQVISHSSRARRSCRPAPTLRSPPCSSRPTPSPSCIATSTTACCPVLHQVWTVSLTTSTRHLPSPPTRQCTPPPSRARRDTRDTPPPPPWSGWTSTTTSQRESASPGTPSTSTTLTSALKTR